MPTPAAQSTAAAENGSSDTMCEEETLDVHALINFVLFQIGWFSSVLGGANGMPWLGPLAVLAVVAIHLRLAHRPLPELMLLLGCATIGAAFDSVLVANDLVGYSSGLFAASFAPYWIIAMYMSFATTLNVSLRWLRDRPLTAAVLGLVAGPLTYLGGAKLGGIKFLDQDAALIVLGAGWALMLPALLLAAKQLDGIEAVPARARDAGSQGWLQ